MRNAFAALAAVAGVAFALDAPAQSCPSKPIEIVVPHDANIKVE